MKQGTTATIKIELDKIKNIDVIDTLEFRFSKKYMPKTEGDIIFIKTYPNTAYFDVNTNTFNVPLTQEETKLLPTTFYVEGQINFVDKSVGKTCIQKYIMPQTLGTTIIDGNVPNGDDEIEINISIDGDIVLNSNYNYLTNKPSLNGHTIQGDKTAEDYDLVDSTEFDALAGQVSQQGEDIDIIKDDVAQNKDDIVDLQNDKADKDTTYTKTEVDNIAEEKQDIISAGNGINIDGNTISIKRKSKGKAILNFTDGELDTDMSNYYDKSEVDTISGQKSYKNVVNGKLKTGIYPDQAKPLDVSAYNTLTILSMTHGGRYKLDDGEWQNVSSSNLPLEIDISEVSNFYAVEFFSGGVLRYNLYSSDYEYVIANSMGDTVFNHREMVDVEVSHDSNYTLQLNYVISLTGTFTGAIPYKDIVDKKVYIDYDSISMVGSQAYYKLGNQSDGSDSIYFGGINYINEQGRNGGYFLIPDYSLTLDYKYLFISLITPNDSYPPQFTNGRIKYTVKQEGYAPRTLNDNYYIKSEVDELLLPLATKEEMKKENEWETIGSVNKGMSGTSTLLDFNDIPIPANNDYRAWRILYYVNPSASGAVNLYFNGQSQSHFWFGGSSTVSGKKFVEIVIESDLWNNIDGTNRNMYGTATLNRCNVYNYGQRTNFLATCGNYIDIANITSIKLDIGASWTFDNTGGCTVILQGRR